MGILLPPHTRRKAFRKLSDLKIEGKAGVRRVVSGSGRRPSNSGLASRSPDVLDRPSGEPDPGVQGIDPDLAAELGRKLGVRLTFVNVKFDSLLDSLRSGRIDAIVSGMSATPDRALQVSFIEYFQAGTSIVVAKGNPKGIRAIGDLCGKTVTVQSATTQADLAQAQAKRCPPGQPMQVRQFDSGSQALLEVKFRHADASLTDFPVAAYNAKVSNA